MPVDLLSPTFKANPYPIYAQLRESAPIHRVELPDGTGVWLVTRYADAAAVLKDERFIKNWRNAKTQEQIGDLPQLPAGLEMLSHNMLDLDPPDHTRLRALVQKAFTPRLIEQMRPRVQAIADELLDAVADQGAMDLIDVYAFPLPIIIIAEILGVPADDRDKFRAWSNASVSSHTQEDFEKVVPLLLQFADYLRNLFAARRAQPRDDLISALLQAEEQGDTLSEAEVFGMVFLLLVAGHETTVNLIGNGTLALLTHPDQLAKLRADPALIKSTVEELLRYDGPVEQTTERYAREDIAIGDVVIPRGEMVLVVLGSADRDPAHFHDPDTLDITRAESAHLAFGKGIHFCLGAPLARLEGQIALSTLFRRLPNLRLAASPEELEWRPGLVLRGMKHLPVTF
jgi:cytochrome P450 PksS